LSSDRQSHFVLTLTQLHRLYTLSRSGLLAELRAEAVPADPAHEALQAAFAAAAKNRFSFRSEAAVIDWVRNEAAASADRDATSDGAAPQSNWEDVLRRANIAVALSPTSLPP
jgi:hypothetical protein